MAVCVLFNRFYSNLEVMYRHGSYCGTRQIGGEDLVSQVIGGGCFPHPSANDNHQPGSSATAEAGRAEDGWESTLSLKWKGAMNQLLP